MSKVDAQSVPDGKALSGVKEKTKVLVERGVNRVEKWEAFFSNQGANIAVLTLLIAFDIGMTWWGVWEFLSPRLQTTSDVLRVTLPIARGAGRAVTWNSALVLISGSKLLWTYIRKTPIQYAFPVDKVMPYYHRLIALTIIFAGCILHTIPQIVNYATGSLPLSGGFWTFGDGFASTQLLITGILLVIFFSAFFVTTLERVRRTAVGFRLFWVVHIVSILAVFPLLIIHGTERGYPLTVYFICGPLVIYIIDGVLRRTVLAKTSASAQILELKAFEDNEDRVTKLVIYAPGWEYRPGNYAEIKIPSISLFEWHPFTIASPPDSDNVGTATFYIKAAGRWTNALYDYASTQSGGALPMNILRTKTGDVENPDKHKGIDVNIRGPFGAPAQNYSAYKHIILIGTGIGVTPALSVWLHLVSLLRDALTKLGTDKLPSSFESSHTTVDDTDSEQARSSIDSGSFQDYLIQKGNIIFTDILNFSRGSHDGLPDEKRVANADPPCKTGEKVKRRALYVASYFESMTVNVLIFEISILIETIVFCIWLATYVRAAAGLEIFSSVIVVCVYMPKMSLSILAYRSRYLKSGIFWLELSILTMCWARIGFSAWFLVEPIRWKAIIYFSMFALFMVLQIVRVFFVFYSTARPYGEEPTEEAESTSDTPSRLSSEAAVTARLPRRVIAIWVNKSFAGMNWASTALADSARNLPAGYNLQLYATRDKPEDVTDPFDRTQCGEQHQVHCGRPNWEKIMHEAIEAAHKSNKDGASVGVFYCGSPAVARDLQATALKVSAEHEFVNKKKGKAPCMCRILVHKENF